MRIDKPDDFRDISSPPLRPSQKFRLKVRRAVRRQQRRRAIVKAEKVQHIRNEKWIGNPSTAEEMHQFALRNHSTHSAGCSCSMCGNPRRIYKAGPNRLRRTIQERRHDIGIQYVIYDKE